MPFNFRRSEVPETSSFAPVPAGKYVAIVDSASEALTRAGDQTLKCTWKITGNAPDAPATQANAQGRLIFDHFLIGHSSEKARNFAQVRLDQCATALGIEGDFETVDPMIGRQCVIRVVIKDGSDGYDPGNEVKAYYPLGSAPAPRAAAPIAASPAPAATTKSQNAAPWKRS